MRAILTVCLGLVIFNLPSSGAQQQEPGGRLKLSVETSLVMMPVTVVDSHGTFVPGLTQSAFTVYDNGVPQAIEFFTDEDLPATVGLVIDSSDSMRGRRDDVTAAGTAFAEFSHPLDEVFTVNFNEMVWPGLPPPVVFAEDVAQLRAALRRAPARWMTALYDAVDRALSHLEVGTHDRKALIVVSDGGDNASSTRLEAVLAHARRTGATIYSVIIADPDDREARPDVLKLFARETGGAVFAPKRAADVTSAFTRIAREIRAAYTIGFPPPDAPEGSYRTLRVVVETADHRRLTARTRAGYHAGRSRRANSQQ